MMSIAIFVFFDFFENRPAARKKRGEKTEMTGE